MDIINAKLNAIAERIASIEAKLDQLLLCLEEDEDQEIETGPFGRERDRGEML